MGSRFPFVFIPFLLSMAGDDYFCTADTVDIVSYS